MEMPAGGRTSAAPLRAVHVCRRCHEPASVQGDPRWGKAVHSLTDRETGPDGHLAAPIDADLTRGCRGPRGG